MFLHPKKSTHPPNSLFDREKIPLAEIYKHKSKRPLLKHPLRMLKSPKYAIRNFKFPSVNIKNPKLSLTTPPPPQKQICAPEQRPLE